MTPSSHPDDRRAAVSRMKDTLARARVGLDDVRKGVTIARDRLAAEERDLETMRRRKRLATDIADAETAALADRYEKIHAERVDVLSKKLAVQEEELRLAERDVAAMTDELRAAHLGTDTSPVDRPPSDPTSDAAADLDALDRAQARAAREADADRKLDELKRRMGK